MAKKALAGKENGQPVAGKAAGIKSGAQSITRGNLFAALEDKDGNPSTAAEFMKGPRDDGEVFFHLDPDVADDDRKDAESRVLILNYINHHLTRDMARLVPGDLEPSKNTEIMHRTAYKNVILDVGVHAYRHENQVETMQAFVKLADADIEGDGIDGTIWGEYAANTEEAEKDKATKIVSELATMGVFYWVPRWKYVVNSLHKRMNAYDKFGTKVAELPEPKFFDAAEGGNEDNSIEIEEEYGIFSGSSGQIIGPKGSKIQKIKAETGVKDIKMPQKDEYNRPRARDIVMVNIIGTQFTINKAKKAIQKNAPRPQRDGGASMYAAAPGWGDEGGNGGGGNHTVIQASGDWESVPATSADWDTVSAAPAGGEGGKSWADDANASAAANIVSYDW
ncbi:hypothetical protein MBM_09303 [Drepanopeziza brunnea f. sp. 'multigermtubi' MB_m1]|uniref:K Homology domain-containing protein n=1 Tax=Marssonina brunnea f. sp. multigermtubi (strain MB_m1) TaxID=1072389 RepID=K1WJY7_MARBU|nr:uncharacterized protein MBM_09303 [Drepanopeziza brunnea f. sp. 'multigermtubi' MB_m1]EKD12547.1 hypothetical protein MBM_09303 [Drepanopeziza brunnea f. sp. 'multigermtubi' MB_m1]